MRLSNKQSPPDAEVGVSDIGSLVQQGSSGCELSHTADEAQQQAEARVSHTLSSRRELSEEELAEKAAGNTAYQEGRFEDAKARHLTSFVVV